MSKNDTKKAAVVETAANRLKPVHIVYKDVDFGYVNPRSFLDKRMDMANRRMNNAVENEDYGTVIDAEGRIYELIFGKDNVDDVLEKLADIHDGYVGDEEMNDLVLFIIEEIKGKNC